MEALPRLTAIRASEAMPGSDDELVACAGDSREAQAEFYLRHREAVLRSLRARCRDEDAALELTAVSFEKALNAIGGYRPLGGGVRACSTRSSTRLRMVTASPSRWR